MILGTDEIILTAMENNIGPRMIHQIPMCSFVPQHLNNHLRYNGIIFTEKNQEVYITYADLSKGS